MAALCNKSVLASKAVKATRPARAAVVVRAQNVEDVNRRAALGAFVGAAALLSGASPSLAAYGDSANVFGKTTNKTGFIPYSGEGFAVNLPSRWGPSKEQDFPGTVLRYEDNQETVTSMVVLRTKADKPSIEAYGATPEDNIPNIAFLFGKQAFTGETRSEGGFAPNRVSAASLLGVSSSKDKKGKTYYSYDYLVRTADGNEGGRRKLITQTVGSDGYLYTVLAQAGDKRWIHGAEKDCRGVISSFSVV